MSPLPSCANNTPQQTSSSPRRICRGALRPTPPGCWPAPHSPPTRALAHHHVLSDPGGTVTPVMAGRTGPITTGDTAPPLTPVAAHEVAHTPWRGTGTQLSTQRPGQKAHARPGQSGLQLHGGLLRQRIQFDPGRICTFYNPVQTRTHRQTPGHGVETCQSLLKGQQAMCIHRTGRARTHSTGKQRTHHPPQLHHLPA